MATFEDVWRRVMLRVPGASAFLAQDWVREAYADACTTRNWSHLRGETTLRTKVAKTGTVDVLQDSLTITGHGLVFAATDVGRQFRVGTIPLYSIATVNVGANTATLDRVYAGATALLATGVVLDAYVTMPTDFKTWGVVTDVQRWWLLNVWVNEQDLSRWDPLRSVGGPPRVLASRTLGQVAATQTQYQFELWPYSLVEAYWPARYFQKPAELTDATDFRGPFANRTDVLVTAALAKCALWPGPSADRKNAYFNLALADRLQKDVDQTLDQMAVQDEDIYPTWLQPDRFTWAPLDAAWLQQTDYAVS